MQKKKEIELSLMLDVITKKFAEKYRKGDHDHKDDPRTIDEFTVLELLWESFYEKIDDMAYILKAIMKLTSTQTTVPPQDPPAEPGPTPHSELA